MTVELPKDAEGREIPLDTGTLYKKNGVAKYIYHYKFDPRGTYWFAETDDGSRNTSEFLINQPDSLEKLEDDLGKILNHPEKVVCAYFNRERKDCDGCKLENCEGSCSHACLRDVIERINKLRGEN